MLAILADIGYTGLIPLYLSEEDKRFLPGLD
jgi:hypothetical protein